MGRKKNHMSRAEAKVKELVYQTWDYSPQDLLRAVVNEFKGKIATGTGLGARWISPVGMVRVDVGFGLQKEGNPVRLHLSIGPDF